MSENPWFVETIQSFLFLNCPECHFKTKEKNFFQDHATKKHPRSSVLFEESSYRSELEEHFDHGIEIELEYPIDIDSEMTKNDQTLEEIMFPEVQNDQCTGQFELKNSQL
jgi:hypothetical protein